MDEQSRSLLELAGNVFSDPDLDVVIDRVPESACELTGARYAALGVLDATRRELERFTTLGLSEGAGEDIGVPPHGRGVLGELILNPVPLRLVEVGEHPHSYGFPHGHPPMHSFLGVPILVGGMPFGSIYLTEKADGAQFTDADEESVVTLARCAGVAIDHARGSPD